MIRAGLSRCSRSAGGLQPFGWSKVDLTVAFVLPPPPPSIVPLPKPGRVRSPSRPLCAAVVPAAPSRRRPPSLLSAACSGQIKSGPDYSSPEGDDSAPPRPPSSTTSLHTTRVGSVARVPQIFRPPSTCPPPSLHVQVHHGLRRRPSPPADSPPPPALISKIRGFGTCPFPSFLPRRNLSFRRFARRFFFAVFYCKSWARPKDRFGFKRPRLLFVVLLLLFWHHCFLVCSWVRESFRRSEWRCPWLTRW